MRIAVDVCVGKAGIRILIAAGHHVVVVAEDGERDEHWFARALAAGAEIVVSPDSDLEILCYDNRIPFFKARLRHSGRVTAHRLVQRLAAQAALVAKAPSA